MKRLKYFSIGVIALCLMVVLTGCELGKKEESNSNTNTNTNTNQTDNTNSSTNQNQNTVASSGYKVSFEGFSFNLPDGMEYNISGDELDIADSNGNWVAMIYVTDGNFNVLKNNVGSIQSLFQQNGFQANKQAEIKSLGGKEYVTIEVTQGGINFTGAYTDLYNSKIAWLVTVNSENTFDYTALTQLASVFSSSTYKPMTNSIAQTKIDVDLNAISELAK